MANAPIQCPVCWSQSARRRARPNEAEILISAEYVSCPRCGDFGHTEEFRFDAERCIPTTHDRGLLSGVIRHGSDAARDGVFPAVIDGESWRDLVRAHAAPTDVEGQIDALLRAVARAAPEYGMESEPEPDVRWASRVYMWDVTRARRLIYDLQSLIEVKGTTSRSNEQLLSLALRLEGWRELRRRRAAPQASTKLFLATWADSAVAEILAPAAQKAADATGLRVVIGNRLAGQGKVDDQIVAEIRSSRVVVADFTGARGGVYFEAGLALGFDIPVIFTCSDEWTTRVPEPVLADARGHPEVGTAEKRWFDLLHFDTRQYPHLLWRTPEEFAMLLVNRIRRWGLQVAQSSASV